MNRKNPFYYEIEPLYSSKQWGSRSVLGFKKLFLTTLFLFSVFSEALAQYSGGDGTQTNPFQISNVNDLILLSQSQEHWSMWFEQTANIDATTTQTLNGGEGFSPIGNQIVKFTGKYNGNNHFIANLYINRPSSDSVGFFGVTTSATITNLRIMDANIVGRSFVGILVGRTYGTQIVNCHTSGSVQAVDPLYGRCGGLIGANGGPVLRSSSTANVSAVKDIVGGLIGINTAEVRFSFAGGSVTGQNVVGGFAGSLSFGTVSQCYSASTVSGQQRVGGFIGHVFNLGQVDNCYSLATITQNSAYTGGFVGLIGNQTVINRCYSNTSIANTSGQAFVGGFAGKIEAPINIQNSFWNIETSNTTISAGGVGKTDAEMKNSQTFLDAGWDFICESANGNYNYWGLNSLANGGYPFLLWQEYLYDNVPPIITSSHNDTVLFVGNNCQIELPDFRPFVQVYDSCSSINDITINQIPSPGSEINTTTQVTLQVIDPSENASFITFTIFLEDNMAPEILSAPTSDSLEADQDCKAILPDYRIMVQAMDNCTSVDSLVIVQSPNPGSIVMGTQNVVLQVFDADDNFSEQSFLVAVVDNTSPTIVCPPDTTILIANSQTFYVIGDNELMPLVVNDNCLVNTIYNSFNEASTLTGASIPLGTHTIQWIAEDISENTTSCSFNLTIAHFNVVDPFSRLTSFHASPNPVNGFLTILLGDNQERTISVIDLQGKIWHQFDIYEEKAECDFSSLPSGVYILQVKSPHSVSVEKIIKQ